MTRRSDLAAVLEQVACIRREQFAQGLALDTQGAATRRRLNAMEDRIVALNDTQQAELLAAVGQVGTDVREAADRVAALIEAQNSDDPELAAAISDLRNIGVAADAIAATPVEPTPEPEPEPEPTPEPVPEV